MEDYMMWDGYNIFGVIFLIVFVVGLSCGLLGFICTRLIEDNFSSDGSKPVSMFGQHRKAANGMILVTPTKITVTRPPKEDDNSLKKNTVEDVENPTLRGTGDDGDNNVNSSSTIMSKVKDFTIFKKRSKSNRDESPQEKIIYSSNNTPLASPTGSIKRFFWSKNNNFDYTANTDDKGNDKDNALFNRQISFDNDDGDRDKNTRVEVNSPMGMYNHILSSRCYSAPSRPHVNRTDTILYI